MRECIFRAYCTFGRGNSGETDVYVELTDEEAERLIKYATTPEIYYNGFNRCKELEGLYNRIYALAVDQMTKEMRDFGDLEEEYANDPDWKVDDLYACGVNFPYEIEESFLEDEKWEF
jgi:hypothetical protein